MELSILLSGIIILLCVLLNKFTQKYGIPMLLAFIVLGLIFGTDGIFKISFENYDFSEKICSVALIFIMFYGGFGTSWKEARPVAVKSMLLSTGGVIMTALLTGLFCHFILRIELLESLLIGSVIASTDAASVFSILRSRKLGLKNNTDSMLELESGSNDPCSYMLTIIVLSAMGNGINGGTAVKLFLSQFGFGILFGVVTAICAVYVLRHFRFATDGFDMAFVIGIAVLSYALAQAAGGNGYLSTYLCGIIIGNQKFHNQKALVHFFDGLTGLMQMLIFFLLGLLATPSRIPSIFLPALAIMLFLTLIARPAAVFAILSPFRCNIRQVLLVSFAGIRGAASIVFAIMATVGRPVLGNDVYHIVFCIVLLSITFQGTLLPICAKWLGMTDQTIDIMKTFSDYSDESTLQTVKVRITKQHPWAGKELHSITMPPDMLVILLRRSGERIIPDGSTTLLADDLVVLSAYKYNYELGSDIFLREDRILKDSKWIGKTIQEYSPRSGELVIMVIRDSRTILPRGKTCIMENDVLVIHSDLEAI